MMTDNKVIQHINAIRRRQFHRLPIDTRRVVVGKLATAETLNDKAIDKAIRAAKREVNQ